MQTSFMTKEIILHSERVWSKPDQLSDLKFVNLVYLFLDGSEPLIP